MRPRLAALLLSLLAALAISAPASAAEMKFTPAKFIDDTYAGGEPLLYADTQHGRLIYSSHEGTTHLYRPGLLGAGAAGWILTYRNQVKIWSSPDNGETWERANFTGTGFTQNPSQNSGFSDPDLSQDEGGRVYNTGINLATNALFSSIDGGVTWDKGTAQCETGDRPWVMGGKPEEVMFVTNRIGPNELLEQVMIRSIDGGNSCGGEGGDAIPNYGTWEDGGGSFSGNGKPYYDHANDLLIAPVTGSGKIGVSVWKRGDTKFVGYPAVEASFYAHWPAIAIDGAGTIYLTYDTSVSQEGTDGGCGNAKKAPNEIMLTYSKDHGKTWSTPTRVHAPTNQFAFWPWITAGDKGKVNIVWYQTGELVDLGCDSTKVDISVWTSTLLNADDDAKRTATKPMDVVGRPIASSNVCETGTTCVATGIDRRLGDFFSNEIDMNGCVMIGTGDTTSPDPVTGGDRAVSLPLFTRQISGPRLIGSGDCSGAPDPPTLSPGVPNVPGNTTSTKGRSQLGLPSTRRCLSRRAFTIRLRSPKGQTLANARVTVAGRKVKVRKRGGRLTARVDLRRFRRTRVTVKVVGITGQNRRVTETRRYRTCASKKRR